MRKKVVRPTLAMLVVIGVYVAFLVITNNFHTVVPGELYRSARPSPAQIERLHSQYGMRTILNLQGAHPDADWYVEEKAKAEALGIDFLVHQMSAHREVTVGEADQILKILRAAKKPILVHCRNGADRSGLVSALYVAGVAGGSEFSAELQLTPIFGHLPFFLLPGYAMDRSFEKAEPHLGFPDS